MGRLIHDWRTHFKKTHTHHRRDLICSCHLLAVRRYSTLAIFLFFKEARNATTPFPGFQKSHLHSHLTLLFWNCHLVGVSGHKHFYWLTLSEQEVSY